MKNILDITDEDLLTVINTIHPTTDNAIIGRLGIFGLDFRESHRQYGDCFIEVQRESVDPDGQDYLLWFTRIKIHHESFWFEEFNFDHTRSTYNKNHCFGYDKLRELGYEFPYSPQWA